MNQWYFNRQYLAEKFLAILDIGISTNLGIVAPRRKGKTLFLLEDIAPAAQNAGYIPVYISLWQNIDSPQEGIIASLHEAIKTIDHHKLFKNLIQNKIKRVGLGNEIIAKFELEFSDKPETSSNQDLLRIDQLLNKLIKQAKGKKILLLIDEVQHLSTSPSFAALSFAMRTLLDKNKDTVKSIMTGSSRHYMHLLFNKPQSPFYNFVEIAPFPDLDEHYLNFINQQFTAITDKKINTDKLLYAFNAIDKSPFWMMKIISHMLINTASLSDSLSSIQQLIHTVEDFDDLNQKLKNIDKIVFLAIANGESPYSKQLQQAIETQTSHKGTPSNIQRAISRLLELQLVSQIEKGSYIIEKPSLKNHLTINKKT